MPDDLTQLQQAVEQRRNQRRGDTFPRWLVLLDRLRRLTTYLGLLIILGVVGSIVWPHIRQAHQERTNPAAATNPTAQSAARSAASRPVREAPPVAAAPASQPPAPVTGSDPPVEAVEPHKLGQAFTIGIWEYRVTGGQWRTPKPNESAAPGHRFLAVTILARNTSHETALLPAPRLESPNGTGYEPRAAASPGTVAAGQPIRPGAQQACRFTFEAPAARGYKILLPAGWLSSEHAIVELAP